MGGVHIDGLVYLIREENEMDPTLWTSALKGRRRETSRGGPVEEGRSGRWSCDLSHILHTAGSASSLVDELIHIGRKMINSV